MIVNQASEEIRTEWILSGDELTDVEAKEALLLVIRAQGNMLVRTNATKHGDVQMQLQPIGLS